LYEQDENKLVAQNVERARAKNGATRVNGEVSTASGKSLLSFALSLKNNST